LWRQAKEEYVIPFMNFCEITLADNENSDWFVGEQVGLKFVGVKCEIDIFGQMADKLGRFGARWPFLYTNHTVGHAFDGESPENQGSVRQGAGTARCQRIRADQAWFAHLMIPSHQWNYIDYTAIFTC